MTRFLPLLSIALFLAACSNEPTNSVNMMPTEKTFDFVDSKGKLLLSYQHAIYPAPEGQSPAFARSGFIHPLNTTSGQRLTQIQPDDHYHHYGIWNPWTHTLFRGREVDFWNLKKEQGTVRFAGLKSSGQSQHSAYITVEHEHVVFNEDGSETVALNELQTIRVTRTKNPDQYLLDLEISYQCGTEDPFKIVEYRYGGLGWRGNEAWNADNSSVLTSEGIPREGSDGSRARWVMAQGNIEGKNAGMVWMSHPNNYNHPEPLRIWPEASTGGALFVNIAPTKTMDWTMEPGKTYQLKYRALVFTGPMDASAAADAWNQFANQ